MNTVLGLLAIIVFFALLWFTLTMGKRMEDKLDLFDFQMQQLNKFFKQLFPSESSTPSDGNDSTAENSDNNRENNLEGINDGD